MDSPTPRRLRPRRNPRWLAAGVLAMTLGGLGGAALYLQVSDARPVLVMTRDVPRGSVIELAAVAVVNLAPAPGVRTVSDRELDLVVGREALVDLAEGALVTPGSVGETTLPAGTVRVGLKLAPGRLPVRALPPGSPVLVLAVPGPDVPGASAAPVRFSLHAEVATSPTESPDGGSQVLDLVVPVESVEALVALASLEQVAIVSEPMREETR